MIVQMNLESTWRGGENQVFLIAKELRRRGVSQALIAHPEGLLWKRAKEFVSDLFPLKRRGEWDLCAAWRLRAILKRLKPDILQVHTAHDAAIAAVAKTGLPIRLLVMRTVDFSLKRNPFSHWKYRQADRIVAVSRCVAEGLKSQGFEGRKIATIYPCLDIKEIERVQALSSSDGRWRREFLAGLGVSPDSHLVGMFGALTAQKDPLVYIEAANLCAREIPDAHFLIAGEGGLRGEVEKKLRSLHLEKRVSLLGFRPDVLQVMACVDCVAVSSVNEGLNLTVLEAAALGIPVVATQVGGVPEAMRDGETGFLVAKGDFKALARHIGELLHDPGLRRRMGGMGREFVKAFAVESIVDQYLALYHEIDAN